MLQTNWTSKNIHPSSGANPNWEAGYNQDRSPIDIKHFKTLNTNTSNIIIIIISFFKIKT